MKNCWVVLAGLMAAGLTLGVTGCAAPAYVAGKRVAPAIPADVKHAEGRIDTPDHLSLFQQTWAPAAGEPKGVVVVLHGLKDYSDRYGALAHLLVQRGFLVRAYDQRGHGDSEGDRVWVDRFSDYVDDLDRFVEKVRAENPGKPLFLFAHSMGGEVAALYVVTRKPKLDGLVLSGPALKTDANAVLRGAVQFFSVVAPKLAVFTLDDSKFSRDPALEPAMKRDPLVYDDAAPARTAGEILSAMGEVRAHAAELKCPVLAVHGENDVVVPPAGVIALLDAASSTDKTVKRYPGMYHDLMHELDAEVVMRDIADWLDAHVPVTGVKP